MGAFITFLGVYFVLALFDPGLLSYDLRQKFHALADETITLTATVLSPPVKPVVTATANCDATTGTLSILLDWATDTNSTTYDIDRDSLSLVSGLTNSTYSDMNVAVNTAYQYEVTGNGPMGPGYVTSDPISVSTPTECEVTAAAPAVTIVSFSGRGIDTYGRVPHVKNRRPLFTGTTSMSNATMMAVVGSNFIGHFSANANGYWEWQPPYNIAYGERTFTVTATDPNDSARSATATLRFEITKPETARTDTETDVSQIAVNDALVPRSKPPLFFSVALANDRQDVFQGGSLDIHVVMEELATRYAHIDVPIHFSVIDEKQQGVLSITRQVTIWPGGVIDESFPIPLYVAPGNYVVRVEVVLDDLNISRTVPFTVRETPLIQLSSGRSISYADIVRNLGWIVLIAVFGVFSWVSFLFREILLSFKGTGAVMARELLKAGFIRK